MSGSPNQDDPSRDPNRDPRVSAAMSDAVSKLKEAQSNLTEAEARLTAASVQSGKDAQVTSSMADVQEHATRKAPTEHLPENVAGTLCYLFGWVSGFVFLLLDRRPFVRFHAAQSVAVFGSLSILLLALSGFFLGTLIPSLAGALLAIRRILELVWLIAAVVLMLKAAGGERYHVALASQYAERAAHPGR
jgi:uncharacterized membrane protein